MINDTILGTLFFGAIGLTLATVTFCTYPQAIHIVEYIDVGVLSLIIINYILE